MFIFLFIFLLQGCDYPQRNGIFILEGDSEHWNATVTLNLEEYTLQPDHFKTRYSKNIVVSPKNEMLLDYISYNTSFNLNFGNSGHTLTPDENNKLNRNEYGTNQSSGGYSIYSAEEVRERLEFAKIEIEWIENGEKYKEEIIAKVKKAE